MARLRNFACYRDYKRAYTRFSKYKNLCYIRSRPPNRISRYVGGTQGDYNIKVHLIAREDLQIRDAALESARQTSNRVLEKALAKASYFIQMRVYPHHVLRENPLASGAGADRLSTGMAHNYGKPIGLAAQIKKGQSIFTVKTTKEHVALARAAMKRAAYKLPCQYSIIVEDSTSKKAMDAHAKQTVHKSTKPKTASVAKTVKTEKPKAKAAA